MFRVEFEFKLKLKFQARAFSSTKKSSSSSRVFEFRATRRSTSIHTFYALFWHPLKVIYTNSLHLICIVTGANILVSAFTITVIALDRWKSVTNTHPADTLTYQKAGFVILAVWAISFARKI